MDNKHIIVILRTFEFKNEINSQQKKLNKKTFKE